MFTNRNWFNRKRHMTSQNCTLAAINISINCRFGKHVAALKFSQTKCWQYQLSRSELSVWRLWHIRFLFQIKTNNFAENKIESFIFCLWWQLADWNELSQGGFVCYADGYACMWRFNYQVSYWCGRHFFSSSFSLSLLFSLSIFVRLFPFRIYTLDYSAQAALSPHMRETKKICLLNVRSDWMKEWEISSLQGPARTAACYESEREVRCACMGSGHSFVLLTFPVWSYHYRIQL